MRRRSDYGFDLPADLVAQAPAQRRDGSRLLVVAPDGTLDDRQFDEIIELIAAPSVVVINDVRVIPARLHTRKPTGGAVELLFLEPVASSGPKEHWRCMARSHKRLQPGTELRVQVSPAGDTTGDTKGGDDIVTVVSERGVDSTIEVALSGNALELLERRGQVPLPPYIARPSGPQRLDSQRYQTVYARAPGAVAAPTAGLHFTESILDALGRRGVEIAPITLHVGLGTFAPMRVENLDDHVMHRERYTIPPASAAAIERARAKNHPVIAVGTTCVRAVESAATGPNHTLLPGSGSTDLFIRPGYAFRVVDHLITNFHLPESTLLMLVCAFAGYDRIMTAYRHAVARRYRFFSYGDAMLLTRSP